MTAEQNKAQHLLGDTGRDKRKALAVAIWVVIWGATFTTTVQTIRAGLVAGLLTWVLVAASAITGFMALRAFVRFVREADEMMQRLYVDALAFGFAAGTVFFAASQILAVLGGPLYGSNELFTAMCFAFAGKVVWNAWRYR